MLTTSSVALLDVSVGQLLAEIPRDAGAIVVYVVMIVFVGLIWLGSRGKGKDSTSSEASPTARSRDL